jgi:HD-GYP domain-containing protein (c-di-GMP phosphodiesterase class II)
LLDTTKGETVHSRSMGLLTEQAGALHTPESIARAAAGEEPAIQGLSRQSEVTEQLQAWERIRASISAPMKVSDVIGGALAAIREETFDTEDLNLLTTLANMSSKAIESAELHQQLRTSYYRTLHVLARSLAARDPYSAAHGEAVTWLSLRLAEQLGLPADEMEALQAYGPLHDLGKIGIADALLQKQGPLNHDEHEIIRQHTVIGESIIQPLQPGLAALAMIRSHHERWDGHGYPDRLPGENIPRAARVLAVADACHAIVSHRPYRGGATPVQAVQEIRAMSGTQFDPEVVDALVQLWHKGILADFMISLGRPLGTEVHAATPEAHRTPQPAATGFTP